MSYFQNFSCSWFTVKRVLLHNKFKQITDNRGVNCYVYFKKKDGKREIRVQVLRSRSLSYPYLIELSDQTEIPQDVFLGQISVFQIPKRKK